MLQLFSPVFWPVSIVALSPEGDCFDFPDLHFNSTIEFFCKLPRNLYCNASTYYLEILAFSPTALKSADWTPSGDYYWDPSHFHIFKIAIIELFMSPISPALWAFGNPAENIRPIF